MTPSGESDISFTTTVRANEVRFHDTPVAGVQFHGTSEHESTSERAQLPDPVKPQVTYRDIQVDYRLAATAQDPDDEGEWDFVATGEIPPDKSR